MRDAAAITPDDLAGFHGGGDRYRHWLGGTYTAGVKYLADKAGAYWLVDAVFSHQGNPLVRREPFQVWVLTVVPGRAVLEMNDGNTERAIVRQAVEFTDFPLDRIELYLTDRVLMLPGEY